VLRTGGCLAGKLPALSAENLHCCQETSAIQIPVDFIKRASCRLERATVETVIVTLLVLSGRMHKLQFHRGFPCQSGLFIVIQ
jgi:hypothetical protein